MSGATPNDVAVAALSLVQTFLSNPNTKVSAKDLPKLINEVHRTAMNLAVQASAGPSLQAPVQAPALPAPSSGGLPAVMDHASGHNDAKVWPGIPREKRQKFSRLAMEHNLQRGPDGVPMPRKPRHLLISADTMTVADPFTGEYFSMLKRRLDVHYGMTHAEVLEMFHLTDVELPKAGPGFSASKRRSALKNKLGHHRQASEFAEASAA